MLTLLSTLYSREFLAILLLQERLGFFTEEVWQVLRLPTLWYLMETCSLPALEAVPRSWDAWNIQSGKVGCHEKPKQIELTISRYDPIQKFAPQDCISSVNGVIEKIDRLVDSRNTEAIQELKTIFGLQDLKDIRDFAMTIAFPSELYAIHDFQVFPTDTNE